MADENEEYGYDPGTSESNSEPAYQEAYQDESQPAPQEQAAPQDTYSEPVPDEYRGAIPAEGGEGEEAEGPPDDRGRSRAAPLGSRCSSRLTSLSAEASGCLHEED